MSITEHWHVDVFIQYFKKTYEVWCRLDIACLSSCKTSNFLLPAGGAMSITEHCHIDVFRPWLLSNV